jgi:ADP-ribose pyrophosphatase YjhB (NUDIX family)
MKYCSNCGEKVIKRIPEADDRPRDVCDSCNTIHYSNPRIIVGIVPTHNEKVLLCKRAIEPRKGFWTLPAGFMENGETLLDGAIRETWEEAKATVGDAELYRIFDLPHINQVYMMYRAELVDKTFGPGQESLEVELFAEQEVPWDQIAFPIVTESLKDYFNDRIVGRYPMKISTAKKLI